MKDLPKFSPAALRAFPSKDPHSVILFASPRTGSSFVGQRLSKAGFGITREWFYDKTHYCENLTLDSIHTLINVSRVMCGRTFSAKIMWGHLIETVLPILPYEVWPEWFGNMHFLIIERGDKLSQACSLNKAWKDNEWYCGQNEIIEDTTTDKLISIYGGITINEFLHETMWAVHYYQEQGERWIKENDIPILKRINYSNLESDTQEALKLLREKNVPRIQKPKPWYKSPVKQANNVNDLLKAFVTETLKITEDEFNTFTSDDISGYLKEFEKDNTNISFKDFLINHS